MAVLPFKAKEGVTQSLADFASELVSTGMVKTKLVTLVDRQSMDAVLKEQAFQKSGCTDDSCAVQIGRLLAANKILTGEIIKAGGTMVINARIVDVEKGHV